MPVPRSPVLQLVLGGAFPGQAEEVLADGVHDVDDVGKIEAGTHLHQMELKETKLAELRGG